jgi:hypothetical protein
MPRPEGLGYLRRAPHTDDDVAMSIGAEPILGGPAAAGQLAVQMANVTTIHHGRRRREG